MVSGAGPGEAMDDVGAPNRRQHHVRVASKWAGRTGMSTADPSPNLQRRRARTARVREAGEPDVTNPAPEPRQVSREQKGSFLWIQGFVPPQRPLHEHAVDPRSDEQPSELQSLMRTSYAVSC